MSQDNIKIVDMNDKFVGYTGFKKALNLVTKKRALQLDEFTIKLQFKPRGYTEVEEGKRPEDYMIRAECSVCDYSEEGDESDMTALFHIFVVPSEFVRKYPIEIRKQQRCHKKVMICDNCNNKYNALISEQKKKIYKELQIEKDSTMTRVKILSKLVIKYPKDSPRYDESKQNYKLKKISELLKIRVEDLTMKQIENMATKSEYLNIGDFETPEEFIVDKYITENKLMEFEKIWVNLFMTLNPQNLPLLWKKENLIYDT
jgi:hypothetical protein